jgi:hypothetical protein
VFAAAKLRQATKTLRRPVDIIVYESRDTVGGRLVPQIEHLRFINGTKAILLDAESSSYGQLTGGLVTERAKEFGIGLAMNDHVETVA